MPFKPIETRRIEAVSANGESFVLCQPLVLTNQSCQCGTANKCVQPYWQTDSGLTVLKENDTHYRVKRNHEWIDVRVVDSNAQQATMRDANDKLLTFE